MKRMSYPALIAVTLISLGPFITPVWAQVSINSLPGGSYYQGFDSLANTGTAAWSDDSTLPGWYAAKTSGTPSYFTNYTAGYGSQTTGALYSFGSAGSTERALGSLASGNANIGNIAYGVRFANDTGADITSITITYTGEQWRSSAAALQTLTFAYRIDVTPITDPDPGNTASWTPFSALDFNTPIVGGTAGALDGNASANRQVFSGAFLAGVAVPAGSEIFLRWRDPNDSGTDHAVAIDDLTVNFSSGTIVTNAPTYASVTPLAQTSKAGTTASFAVTSDGSPSISLSCEWRKDGTPLRDGGNILGSATPTLIVSDLLAADAGSYDVIVANPVGSVASDTAMLTVIDPAILSQSADQSKFGGENATLTVTAKGTPVLAYQWFRDGTPVDGATGSALPLSNLQAADQGTYTCWVTNGLGASVASAPINLSVTVFPSATLAVWDFNDTNAPATSPPPSIGAGTATLLGGVGAAFASGVSADHSLSGTNTAWNTATYPAQGTANKTAGANFSVSTVGYQNICLAWHQRHSSTASKYTRLQYTTDGTAYLDLDLNTMNTDGSFVFFSRNLSTIPGVNNNGDFGFRIVSEFESPGNPMYVATAAGSTYGPSGTIRFDLVRVYGDLLNPTTPAPTSISHIDGSTLTYGGGGGSQFVLLKSTGVASPLSGWTRVATNFATPGTFSLPAGSGAAVFYRIKSE